MNIVDIIFIATGLVAGLLVILVSRVVRAIVVESLTHPLRTASIIRDGNEVRVEPHLGLSDHAAQA
jgi:hypothetical protein